MLAITAPPEQPTVNLLLLGDAVADKTGLVCAYLEQFYPDQHVPCVFFEHPIKTTFKGEPVTLNIWDLSGQECYDKLRQLAYKQIGFHVFVVCFSVVEPESLDNVRTVWVPELKWHCPNTPFLLVGTQIELRTDKQTYERLEAAGKSPVSRWAGQRLAKQLGATVYLECSARRREGLGELFDASLMAGLRNRRKHWGSSATTAVNGHSAAQKADEGCSIQ